TVVAVFATFLALTAAAQPDAPLPPATVKFRKVDATLGEVAAELSKISGVPISVDPAVIKEKCPAAFDGTPLWEALERAAVQAKAKIVLVERGRKIALEPKGQSRTVSAVSGPFRVVATQVVGRALLDLGTTVHEVDLDVHWEPRYTVFRIDASPRITRAADDANKALETKPAASRVQPDGASSIMKVTLG